LQDGGNGGEVQLSIEGQSVDTIGVASNNDSNEIWLGKAQEGGGGDASELPEATRRRRSIHKVVCMGSVMLHHMTFKTMVGLPC
jgi:hypothetical protein